MKKQFLFSALFLVLPLSHCSPEVPISTRASANPSANPSTTPPGAPSAAPVEMTDDELKTLASNYTENLKAINTELEPSNIHGSRVKTFLDPTAFDAYQSQSFPYAANTVSVKESHASESGPISRLYVMKKIPGYDTANNDWFYAVMSTAGVPSEKGKVQYCIACHAGNKNKDYLFGFQ
jgi:hypothetical protein